MSRAITFIMTPPAPSRDKGRFLYVRFAYDEADKKSLTGPFNVLSEDKGDFSK